MRHSLLLAASTAALIAGAAWAQEDQPAETTEETEAPATEEQPATEGTTEATTEEPATEPPATEGAATETQTVTTTGGEGAAAGGDPMQALTQAGQQLQQVSQQMQGGEGGDQQQMQTQATQALDQFDQALQQASQAPEGQEAQEQITALQQQSEQVRQQIQDDPQNAGQGLQELADAAAQLQTASIPAEADAIMGRQVVTADGEEAGEVRDVLITSDGKVEAVLIERGGALGLGGTQIAVNWDQIQLQGDQIMVNATRDEMEQMPEYQTE